MTSTNFRKKDYRFCYDKVSNAAVRGGTEFEFYSFKKLAGGLYGPGRVILISSINSAAIQFLTRSISAWFGVFQQRNFQWAFFPCPSACRRSGFSWIAATRLCRFPKDRPDLRLTSADHWQREHGMRSGRWRSTKRRTDSIGGPVCF